jgi:uncharacterized membrane protein
MIKNRKQTARWAALALFLVLAACARSGSEGAAAESGRRALAPEGFYQSITWVVIGLETAGVASILVGFLSGVSSYIGGYLRKEDSTVLYVDLRERLGRAILVGLEFLVAADIVNTVTVDPTLHNLATLAVVVLIRTFLSFAIEVEIHGRWPWQHKNEQQEAEENPGDR